VRVVLDTSTLIAAHISRAGVCSELFEEILLHHELVVSEYILAELERKLRDQFGFPDADVHAVSRFLRANAELVDPDVLPASTGRDPEDLPILGTAIAAGAAFLITVDRDLLDLVEFRGFAVIKPGEYWQRVEPLE